jgi:hypothetical protein
MLALLWVNLIIFPPLSRTHWERMTDLSTHGTQYKVEAAAILTGTDHSSGNLELIVFLNEG